MPNVNPGILRWARETAGLAPEAAVKKLGIRASRGVHALDRLEELETGKAAPSRPMLVKMAKQYRRPLLTFYLSDIPREGDRGDDFRTLPEPADDTDAALVDAVIRDIGARQALVRASLEAADEAVRLPFIGSMVMKDGVAAVVASIEQTLGFERAAFRDKGQIQGSFAYFRGLAEAAGIFVLLIDNLGSWHSTVAVELFRGFALADDVAPFVAVNANDSPSAWSFTLAHELAHLWIGSTGVSDGTSEHGIEKFCNDVASELLLSGVELAGLDVSEGTEFPEAMALITGFAGDHKVSSTMVAYKLYRVGAFGFDRYQHLKNAYRRAFLDRKKAEKQRQADKEGGPTYYVVRRHRVGATLIQLVDRMMYEGNLSTTKAGKVLGVGPHNVYALLQQGRPEHVT